MNFIRDIIAERTKPNGARDHLTCETETATPVASERQANQSDEIDPVHRVASGGVSLSPGDPFAYQRDDHGTDCEAPQDDPQENGETSAGHLPDEMENTLEGSDDLGLASDPSADHDPSQDQSTGQSENFRPSELFADLWDGDKIGNKPAENDFFAQDEPQYAAKEPVTTLPGDSKPETNTQALMRTIYPTPPEDPGEAGPENVSASAPASGKTEATGPREESPAMSAFHRIKRRQAALPTGPDTIAEPETAAEVVPDPVTPIAVPAPAAGRARRQAGRVKTRLLGFGDETATESDPFAAADNGEPAKRDMFPVGWMVVVSGPGRGTAFTLLRGVSQIGRGEGQAVRLDFGDNSISRENHAAVAYDPEQQAFFLGHGGKTNLVRLNGMPVLSTEPLKNGAVIRIGETTLKFVGLCGTDFDWGKSLDGEAGNARLD